MRDQRLLGALFSQAHVVVPRSDERRGGAADFGWRDVLTAI
jgi:hypothetical protein